ncbi:MAG: diaminopropionate ammonia-lyase, partial [Candidatus Celaenobacter antarcticus]|nr:diaminopropionate ammonia-lyase [Candidatus Celaenobacter antarcticus]
DPFVVSGESGAVTLGVLGAIMKENGMEELISYLKLDKNSRILLINTEGNTDPIHFRQIIWEGANPVPPEYWTDED